MCQTHLSRAAAIFAEVGVGTRLRLDGTVYLARLLAEVNKSIVHINFVNRKDEDVCRLQDTLIRSCIMACVRALVIILYSSWYLQAEATSSEGG